MTLEYNSVLITDKLSNPVFSESLTNKINEHASDGWTLVSVVFTPDGRGTLVTLSRDADYLVKKEYQERQRRLDDVIDTEETIADDLVDIVKDLFKKSIETPFLGEDGTIPMWVVVDEPHVEGLSNSEGLTKFWDAVLKKYDLEIERFEENTLSLDADWNELPDAILMAIEEKAENP